jgi:drug/metabolite transporter (DMT)-like permease
MMPAFALALTSVLLSSLAQLLLKQAANTSVTRQDVRLAWLNPLAMLGYGMLLTSVLTSAYVLRYLGIGVSTSLTALAYPLVALLSRTVFKETIQRRQWLGMSCVCLGVLVFNWV